MIDTATKRRSVHGYSGPFVVVLPVADGAVGASDRAHVGERYRGLDYGVQAPTRFVALRLGKRPALTLDARPTYRLRGRPTLTVEEE